MIADQDTQLTILQAAQATGLTIHTLRYYERIELLDPVPRLANGHRRYAKQDIDRIVFLNHLRLTGMPLEEMKRYSELLRQGEAGLAERIAILTAHRETVAERMEALGRMLGVIDYKIDLMKQQSI